MPNRQYPPPPPSTWAIMKGCNLILLATLVLKCSFCLLPEHTNGNGDYTSSLLGILVMQDVHLGLLVALLPAIAGQKSVAPSKGNTGVVHNILNGLERESDSGNLGFLTVIAKLFLPITGLQKSSVRLSGTSRFHCWASNY